MKKIPFPGRRQRRERETGKLLLIHAKLHSQHRTVFLSVFHPFHTAPTSHSHIENIYTPTHPVPNIQLTHTLHPEKHPHFMYKFRVQHLFLDVLCPFPLIGPPYYIINPGFGCSNSSCFCCRVTFGVAVYLACTLVC